MDAARSLWYFSNMPQSNAIPVFTLYGETAPFPDILHCERYSARAPVHGWRIAPHRHARLSQLFVIVDGGVAAHVEGEALHLKTGDFLFVSSQSVHEFVFQPETEGFVISFPNTLVDDLAPRGSAMQSHLSSTVSGACADGMLALADLLEATVSTTTPFRAERMLGLAYSMLGLVAEHAARRRSDHKGTHKDLRMQQLDGLIAQHHAKAWTAKDYAQALSLSTGHLSRLCRACSGMGATAYIEHQVMEEACRLLAFTQVAVSEIGYRLGYSDPSYFSKRFRIVHGQTPSDYRAMFSE